MDWKTVAFLLCAYGLLKEFKPIEPYLYKYQHNYLNISGEILNSEVYPLWTYSYLLLSVPVMLLTDVLLYKPVLVLESLAYICVWLTLIYGGKGNVGWQQLGQLLFGLATATEIAFFAYAYVKVQRQKYARLTAWSRAALQFGKCFAYILAQLILLLGWGDYLTLNYISLYSVSLTLLFALALPTVSWREMSLQQNEQIECDPRGPGNDSENIELTIQAKTYGEFVRHKTSGFYTKTKQTYSDGQLLRWSIWWAMATCGTLQIGNYIQLLWGEVQIGMDNSKIYNGFVEGIIPLLSALAIMGIHRLRVDWCRWGELFMFGTAFVQCIVLFGMSKSWNLPFLYGGYAITRILYQMGITVAQINIALRMDVTSGASIFGLNMFFALFLQTILTFLVVDSRGPFVLSIRAQFLVYALYHTLIAVIFLFSQIVRCK